MRDPYQIVDKIDEMKVRVREDFTRLIEMYKNPIGIEIGVHRGLFSEHLLSRTGENLTLYGVDIGNGEKGQRRYEEACGRLARFGARSKIIRLSSADASREFDNGFFDFIYIDGDYSYEGAKANLNLWWPKAKDGAIFSGYNYVTKRKHVDVVRAVNEFVKEKRQELFFTYEDGATQDDKIKSFYLFKNMAP